MIRFEDLTEIDQKALRLLRRPSSCANLGWLLWPGRPVGAICSCPYARPAGKVVARLRARGLVVRGDGNEWRISMAGLQVLARAGESDLRFRT
jgi:hypothetical protein